MILGYVSVSRYFEAIHTFNEMRNAGVRSDAVTYTSILSSCSQTTSLEKGREIHNYIIEDKLESSEIVMGALLDMYAKYGAVDDARQVFDQLPVRDFVSWTSMITAYGSHGKAIEALELFCKMQESEAKLDRVTFLAVISACSHAGLVDEGCYYFNLMIDEYGFKPTLEHYSCLVDLLSHVGRLNEAYTILQNNPTICADVGLLSSLLSVCNLHGNLELGEEVGRLLCERDPDDSPTYIILSNMYVATRKWNKVGEMRAKMKDKGLKKNPECSWIKVDKKIHPFFVEDKSHPRADLIYQCLGSLALQMDKDELNDGILKQRCRMDLYRNKYMHKHFKGI